MPEIMAAINESWPWLGPWVNIFFGLALLLLIKEVFSGPEEELREWRGDV